MDKTYLHRSSSRGVVDSVYLNNYVFAAVKKKSWRLAETEGFEYLSFS
jgi:hypothetical protein